MASYNKFNNNLKNDSIIIPIANCSTSIFAGFVVFSVLGYLSSKIIVINFFEGLNEFYTKTLIFGSSLVLS